jgi:hypothetical protein
MIRIESTAGVATQVSELELFDDRLREQPAVIEPCSSLDTRSGAIAASFVVEAASARGAVDTASEAFDAALAAAGSSGGAIERLELGPADERELATA